MAFFTATRVFSALIFGAIIVPIAASAAEPATDTRIAVSTSGLNATKPADQAKLRHRIAVAAHQVCDQVTPGGGLTSSGYAECFARATADARVQLDRQIATANSRALVASVAQ